MLVEDAPKLVEDAPMLVEDAPKLIEDAPKLVEDAPKLVEVAPKLVEDALMKVFTAPLKVFDAPLKVCNVSLRCCWSPTAKFSLPKNNKQKFSLRTLNFCLNGVLERFEGLKGKINDKNQPCRNKVNVCTVLRFFFCHLIIPTLGAQYKVWD